MAECVRIQHGCTDRRGGGAKNWKRKPHPRDLTGVESPESMTPYPQDRRWFRPRTRRGCAGAYQPGPRPCGRSVSRRALRARSQPSVPGPLERATFTAVEGIPARHRIRSGVFSYGRFVWSGGGYRLHGCAKPLTPPYRGFRVGSDDLAYRQLHSQRHNCFVTPQREFFQT